MLSGPPGLGSPAFLALHTDAIVSDSLMQLDAAAGAALSVQIPVLMDCAVLGRRLPQDVNGSTVIAALATALRFDAEPHLTEDLDDESLGAVLRLAIDDSPLRHLPGRTR